MAKKTVRDIELKDKRVFVRVDYNVPMKEGVIRDDTRIQASLPTVKYLVENGAKVILASHMGRPDGARVESLSLKPVAERLSELIGKEVKMLNDCIGEEVEKAVAEMKASDVVMLENLRFYKAETKNDPEFAKKLASLADVYVDDAFGTAHRAHASTYGVAELLPVRVSGFLIEKELKNLGNIIGSPKRPFVAILGGAKVKDKVAVIKNLLNKVDSLIIGGAMAYSFFAAKGIGVGKSLLDDNLEPAKEILKIAEEKNLDLVKIAPQAKPPVCKIMDYSKYRFEQAKREKEARKNQHVIEIKEIRLSLNIDKHDFETKVNHARRFLTEGNKVKVSIRFRGREMAHPENGLVTMSNFAEACQEFCVVEKSAKLEGRSMMMFLAPKTKK